MPMMRLSSTKRRLATPLMVALLLGSVVGCGPSKAPGAASSGGPPPAEVGVVTVEPGAVALLTELPGRLEASRVAQVRARATGIVQARLFREGSEVRAGQRLFQIDPAPYEVALQSALATLARAQAQAAQARALAERYAPLVKDQAVSQQEWVNAQAAQQQAEAEVAVAQATVQNARLNLGHTQVIAPIAGRIGRALVTEGALVGQGEATALAVVQQVDPLYVNFTQSAAEVHRLRRALAEGRLKGTAGAGLPVHVVLEDGQLHAHEGRLLFADLTVDSQTGQITLRAEVPNPDGQLLPGLYVRVRLSQAQAEAAVLLPQQAVTRAAQGDHVLVVDDQGQVQRRAVHLGGQRDGRWVVLEGLQAGERVVVDGFQKLRPGAAVKPVPWQPPGTTTATSGTKS